MGRAVVEVVVAEGVRLMAMMVSIGMAMMDGEECTAKVHLGLAHRRARRGAHRKALQDRLGGHLASKVFRLVRPRHLGAGGSCRQHGRRVPG